MSLLNMSRELLELSPGEVLSETPAPAPPQWKEDLYMHRVCRECRVAPPNFVTHWKDGIEVCGDCGLIAQENIIDTGAEWRTFQNDDQDNHDPSRVGEAANPLLNGSQLSTEISFNHGDARSRELNHAQNKANEDKGNEALLEAYRQISSFCDAIHLSTVVATMAKQLYKLTTESKQFKGKLQDVIIAVCIFIACRQQNVGRSFKEITELTKVPTKELYRVFKEVEKFCEQSKAAWLRTNAPTANGSELAAYRNTNSTQPKDLCGRFGNYLQLPANVSIYAGECADMLLSRGMLAGRSPLSVAAVALYIISNLMNYPKSTKEIGQACSVSDGTIRTAWRIIYDDRLTIIKQTWIDNGGNVDNLPPA
jgi:transcription initiation factor TFIIB